jgi:hypothetical protein
VAIKMVIEDKHEILFGAYWIEIEKDNKIIY